MLEFVVNRRGNLCAMCLDFLHIYNSAGMGRKPFVHSSINLCWKTKWRVLLLNILYINYSVSSIFISWCNVVKSMNIILCFTSMKGVFWCFDVRIWLLCLQGRFTAFREGLEFSSNHLMFSFHNYVHVNMGELTEAYGVRDMLNASEIWGGRSKTFKRIRP